MNLSKAQEVIIAGFGGQGVMFAGKLIASAGMLDEKEVSWLPSYGPEMRGGTANCHVIVSDELVGSPIIVNPTTLIVLNRPSLDKFENTVLPGGILMVDTSLVDRKVSRTDIKVVEISATQLALDMGERKLGNMVILGKWIRETGLVSMETVQKALKKAVPAGKEKLIELNIKALEIGYNYN